MKRNMAYIVPLMLVLLLIVSSMATAQISIVVSKSSVHKITKESARDIFAGAVVVWENGSKVQIIDQSDTPVGKDFYENYVGKSSTQIRLQWTKLVLSGQAVAPKKLATDDAVLKAVSEDPNAVGYVKSSSVDGSVKEIGKIQ
jgi:ABC-type phosphate transport system substrate-binding protein